jgi:hypothetical protein
MKGCVNMAENAKWTFMVYMAGDNNLSDAGDQDLKEMREVGSTGDVNIIVQFDNAGNRGTQRFRVLREGNDLLESIQETDSGDPNVLLDFVKWAKGKFPADRYALVLWNHGGGWEPSEVDKIAEKVKSLGYNNRDTIRGAESPLHRVFFRPTLEKILSLDSPQQRAICEDDGSGHSLDTLELGKVLEKIKDVLGKNLDMLGMDACLMCNLEVAYQVQPYVNYIVGSEESEPGEGWPYKEIVSSLIDDPEQGAADFASHIVDAYINSYIEMGSEDDVTQSAFNLANIGSLDAALDDFADELCRELPDFSAEIWKAHKKSKRFFYNTLVDIGNFSENIEDVELREQTKNAAKAVINALQTGSDKFILAAAHRGTGVAATTGVTVYLPSPINGISQYYKDLEFASKQKWMQMLKEYVEA